MIPKKRFISILRALSNEDSPVSFTVMANAIETSPLRVLDSLSRRNLANDNGSEDKESKAFALKALEVHNDVMHPDGPDEIPEDHPYWENTPLNLFGWVEDELPNFEITDPNLDKLDIQEIKEKLITNSKKTKFSPIKITDQWIPEAKKIAKKFSKSDCRLTVDKLAEKTHKEMVAQKITGRGGKVPSIASIKRHALTRIRS